MLSPIRPASKALTLFVLHLRDVLLYSTVLVAMIKWRSTTPLSA